MLYTAVEEVATMPASREEKWGPTWDASLVNGASKPLKPRLNRPPKGIP